jgi:hypothetical protein
MPNYHEFDKTAIEEAHALARQHEEMHAQALAGGEMGLSDSGALSLRAQCISVTSDGHQICLNLPIVGKKCLPLPVKIPSGTALQVCLDICYTWKIPTGVKVTVSAGGHVILTKTFGKC